MTPGTWLSARCHKPLSLSHQEARAHGRLPDAHWYGTASPLSPRPSLHQRPYAEVIKKCPSLSPLPSPLCRYRFAPTAPADFWSITVGNAFIATAQLGCDQVAAQRCLAAL